VRVLRSDESVLKGLHVKVLVPLVLVIATATTVCTVAGAMYESRLIDEIVADRAQSLGASIRRDISRAMRTGDPWELQNILLDLAGNPDVVGVRILATDGTVLRSTRAIEEKLVLTQHVEQASTRGDLIELSRAGLPTRYALHSVQPLLNGAECSHCHGAKLVTIALLDLDVDIGRQRMSSSAWWTLNAALGGIQVIALTGLVYPILSVLVMRPIRGLTRAVHRVQEGHLEPIEDSFSTREFASLGAGYNDMVHRLRETAEREEHNRRLQLERAEQLAAVGELAVGLAHEIRSPLSAVKAAVEVLADDLPPNDPRRDILMQSGAELGRIGGVTRELLEYARPRAPSFAAFDLNALLDDVVLLNEPQAARQGAVLHVVRAPQPLAIEADQSMIRQVLVNLTINALHAVAARPDARVTVSAHLNGREVLCRVRDNGPGVPAAQGETIFRPFVTTKARGTGLGLAISRRLIEMNGGRLSLENAGHQGASFAFTLPAAEPPQ
jgi:signal transduction histidine kinase